MAYALHNGPHGGIGVDLLNCLAPSRLASGGSCLHECSTSCSTALMQPSTPLTEYGLVGCKLACATRGGEDEPDGKTSENFGSWGRPALGVRPLPCPATLA